MSDRVAPSKGAAVTNEQLNADFDRLAETVLRIKREHGQMAERIRRSKDEHFAMAALLGAWAKESVEGGWSTHQVDAMRRRADRCRKYGAEAESLLTELEGEL